MRQRRDDRAHHAGAGDADVDDLVGLARAVDGAGHERVVLDMLANTTSFAHAIQSRSAVFSAAELTVSAIAMTHPC